MRVGGHPLGSWIAGALPLALSLVLAAPLAAQPGDDDGPSPSPTVEEVEPLPEVPARPTPRPSTRPAATATATASPPPRVALPAPVQIRTELAVPVIGVHVRSGVEEFVERLETRASYLRKGNKISADVELGQLYELRDALGAVNVPLASSLLVHESREALARGDLAAARDAAEAAVRLSPDLVPAHWQRFEVAWTAPDGLGAALGAARGALAARVHGFRNQVALLTDLLGVLVLTVLGVAAVFALLQLIRYVRCAVADVAERLPSWAGPWVAGPVVALVLFAPLAVGIGLAPTLMVWLAGAMLYQTTRERGASLALLAALGAIPLLMYAASPLLLVHGSSVDALAALATEAFAPEAEARLVAEAEKSGKKDYELAFLLGRRARAMGDLDGAQRWYEAALAARPGDVAARNNLGVVFYLQRRPDMARTTWREAGATRPEPLLNTSALDLEASRFEEAKASLAAARRIDPARTTAFSDATGSTAERLVEVPFAQGLLWDRLSRDVSGDAGAIVQGLWARIGGPVPWAAFPLVALALGLFAWALGSRGFAPFSTPCHKCGQPAHRRAVDGYCAQCQTIFLRAVAVEPGMRLEKERAIRRYQGRAQWGERLFSLLAGAGHVLGGRPVEGLLLMAPFVGALVHWLWMARLSVHPWATGLGMGHGHLWIAGAVCAVLTLFALRRTWAR